jgi:hypothetical protein
VDPNNFYHRQEYIQYLKFKIEDLEKEEGLEDDLKPVVPYPRITSLSQDPLCPDIWCKCSYHMKKNQLPLSPPSSDGGDGPSQYSGGGGGGGYDRAGPS